jgi:hypothetical protein
MGATTHSIEVNAPLQAVYNQWTQFEEFPRFMEGVDEVRQDGPKSLFWKAKIGGKDKQWEAEITQQIPDKRIAWESIDGTPNRGEVTFESLDFERTRITLTMEYEPEGFFEKAGDALGIPSGRVEIDLKRFGDFIEKKGRETGGWRGQIEEEESPDSTAKAVRQEGALSVEDAPERKIKAQDREIPREPAVIEEIERGMGGIEKDRIAAKGGERFQTAEYRTELEDESTGTAAPTHEQIARRAYELYIERGEVPGDERADWLEAEKELSEKYGDKRLAQRWISNTPEEK